PARQWRISGLTVDGGGFSTVATDPPATLRVRAEITAQPGSTSPTILALDADSLQITPRKASGRLKVEGLALAAVEPYWPPEVPVTAPVGSISADVTAAVEQGDAGLSRAVAAGRVDARGIAIVARGQSEPVVKIPALAIGLREVDALANRISLS